MNNRWQSRPQSRRYSFAGGSAPKQRRFGAFRTRWWLIPAGVVAVCILVNVVVFAIYRDRTYPRTKVMAATIGSVSFSQLEATVSQQNLLPDKVALQYGTKTVHVTPQQLGLRVDNARAVASAREQRSWLPVANFFRAPTLLAPVAINSHTSDAQNKVLATVFTAEPVNPRLNLAADGMVTVVSGVNGYRLQQTNVRKALLAALDKGKSTVTVPVTIIKPRVTKTNLIDDQQVLEKQLSSTLTYRYNGSIKTASRADIASWYVQTGTIYTLSTDNLQNYLTSLGKALGITIKDRSQVAASTTSALTKNTPLDLTLAAVTAAKNYTYCTATRGVSTNELPTLHTMLESTYHDARGWNLSGQVGFQHGTSGCDYTVWLSAADQMPSFGGVCDSTWSCRSGPNVVINFDRWQGASPAWNEYGGSLEDYRHMVINHETGHWLGFSHATCPGAGQIAPVMQQQSISLQGCKFNPWPTASELATLKSRLGI